MAKSVKPASAITRHELHVAYVHPDDFALIEHAAMLQQLPLDEFVLMAAFRTAADVIGEIDVAFLKIAGSPPRG